MDHSEIKNCSLKDTVRIWERPAAEREKVPAHKRLEFVFTIYKELLQINGKHSSSDLMGRDTQAGNERGHGYPTTSVIGESHGELPSHPPEGPK